MIRRIDFERELSHAAHVLLGGNRDAERGVGTEGFKIARGFAHVFETENHRHRIAAEFGREHGLFLAGIFKGIVVGALGHGCKM